MHARTQKKRQGGGKLKSDEVYIAHDLCDASHAIYHMTMPRIDVAFCTILS